MRKIIFLFFISRFFCTSGQVYVSGRVTDTLGEVLAYANVIADPSDDSEIKYGFSNKNGFYKIRLLKGKEYYLSAMYLGYETQVKKIILSKDTVLNFVLKPSTEQLEDVVIKVKPSVVIKPDTISFRAKSYMKGHERKLKDILKNIPGMEVDRRGNVKFQGRIVSTVLVENRKFFSGQTTLATNNIPSNAIEEIQIIDNYEETGFMKKVRNSDRLALNIKLKEDKKKFWFGIIEAGVSADAYYQFHPSVYRFSPEFQMNFISDFNNTGENAFSYKDFLEFENVETLNLSEFFGSYNAYYQLFSSSKKYYSKNNFGALHISKQTQKNQLSAYIIAQNPLEKNKKINERIFLINDSLNQIKEKQTFTENSFFLGKIKYRSKLDFVRDFNWEISYQINKPYYNQNAWVNQQNKETHFTNIQQQINQTFKQILSWKKNFDEKYVSNFDMQMSYSSYKQFNNWLTDQNVRNPFLSLLNADTINLHQINLNRTFLWSGQLKHYYLYHNLRQMIFSVGFRMLNDHVKTESFQNINDSIFYFPNFGNDLNLLGRDIFIGIWWRIYIGDWIGKFGMTQHFFSWKSYDKISENKSVYSKFIEPSVKFNYKNEQGIRIVIRYDYKSKFSYTDKWLPGFYLTDFFTINQGRFYEKPIRWHEFNFHLSDYNRLKRFSLGINITKRVFTRNVITNQKYFSLYTFTQYKLWPGEQNNLIASFYLHKWWKILRIYSQYIFSRGEYDKLINNNTLHTKTNQQILSASIQTVFSGKFPNFQVGAKIFQTNFNSVKTKKYNTLQWQAGMDYQKNAWNLRFYIQGNEIFNSNRTRSTHYTDASMSIEYIPPRSYWSLELTGTNLLNEHSSINRSQSDLWLNISEEYLMPRIFLLKLILNF